MTSLFVKVLYKKIILLALLFVVTLVIVMLYLSNITPKYQTNARVLVEAKIQDISAMDRGSSLLTAAIIRNQMELLKSRTLFGTALKRAGLDSDPNSASFYSYYSHFSVKQLPFSTMLQLQVTGESPETITNLTNVLVECLIEENNKLRSQDVTETEEYLNGKIEEIQMQKIELQNTLTKFPDTKRQSTPKAWSDLKSEVLKYEKELKDIKNKIKAQDWQEAAFIFSEESPVIKDYRGVIRPYIVPLVNLLLQPTLHSKKINDLQAKIWREKVKTAGYMKIQLDALQLEPNDNWQTVTYAYLRVIDFNMRQEIMGKSLAPTYTSITTEEEKIQLTKKLDSLKETETSLVQKVTNLQVSEGITNIAIKSVDKAIVPEAPYFPTFMQSLIMAFLAALGVTMTVVYFIIIFGKEEIKNQKPVNLN